MNKKIVVRQGIRTMLDKDGAVLLDLDAGKYFSLNGVAAEVWEKIEEGMAFSGILLWMEEQYGSSVPKERLEQDLKSLFRGLEAKDLIRAVA